MLNLRKKSVANITATKNALDGMFLNISNNTINIRYLIDSIEMWIDNTKSIYDMMFASRMQVHSVVWYALQDLINDDLKYDGYVCTSYHLKKWFESYKLDYKEVLKALVNQYEEERKNRK